MYNSIVVPLDGSAFSEHALPIACALATRTGAILQLLHVHALSASPIYVEGLPVIDEKLISQSRAHAFAYLQQVQTRLLASQPKLNIVIKAIDRTIESIVQEPLGAFLATYIAATNPGLVIMTTHGRGGLARAWLGSVADTLIRLSHIPILLVQPTEVEVDFGQAPPFKHILITLDGSTLSEQILEPTLALGALLGAECTLLQVVEPLFPVYNAVAHTQELDAAGVQIAQRYLRDILQRFQRAGLSLTTHVILAEQPAATILTYAQQHAVDLIALATHGRSGLPRLWLGSVGDKVLRAATMPVLIYRPQVAAEFA